MIADLCAGDSATVAGLPSEDIVVLAAGTSWQVPWELMMLGPFASCGLIDGTVIRHVTVPMMVASAARRCSAPCASLTACDYPPMPVFTSEMPLIDAAVLVVETGWDLAVVMAREPRVITARSVYRALVGSAAPSAAPSVATPAMSRCCARTSPTPGRVRP
jgi:hypothetical protein